ncbi:hypothetical protein PSHT_00656 [Puccinia striiformis]|uniref:Uncharacterized protein n=1 Tax=Puccinia striiformis TaxID=27350 RepID=A0A2S4WME8_9BASI|nr:hypothetical protein PSHT_00656 [Puccinia striiformis]
MECEHVPIRHINLNAVSNLGKLFQDPINILNNYLSSQGTNPSSPQHLHEKYLLWYANWQFRRFHITYRDIYADFLIEN